MSLINPKIVETSEATDVEDEACLSFPDIQGKVRRHKWIKVLAHPPQLCSCDVLAFRYMLTLVVMKRQVMSCDEATSQVKT